MPVVQDWKGQRKFVPPALEPPEVADLSDWVAPDSTTVTVTEDGTVVTQMPDGSAIIGDTKGGGLGGKKSEFSDNMAEDSDVESALSGIVTDLLDGIDADIRSRQEMVSTYTKGMDMLGLKIEDRSGKRQRKQTSTVRHPVLLESIVQFQSGAMAELLPATGPCKVKIDDGDDNNMDELAQALENDINHYLTTVATEYYPDTDRGLFYLGYGGTLFKKVYNDPIRKRPVSECVYMTDLIVSEQATDLENALRVTHQIMMNRGDVKRMQHAGAWRKIELTQPSPIVDQAKQKIGSLQGLNKISTRPKDQQHTIYECYCELIPSDCGFKEPYCDSDIPLPYMVTIDKDSRTVLDMRRIWKEGDENYQRQLPFVMYGLVPGLGFLNLGFLHLIGNQTRALTAIWRILIDAGMFSNFPGGVRIKGTRQSTNEIQPGPGEWPEIDTGPAEDIRSALMPLPYKEPSAVFIQLSEIIGSDAQRMGSVVEMPAGEGKAEIPVGTMLAMIEQQTKMMASVHKRLHVAQKQELMKLKVLFAEDPEALYRTNPKARQWKAEELNNLMLVPASDPNIPSQAHRIMQATALVTLASNNPDIYDKFAAHQHALRTIGITDTQQFIHQAAPQSPQQDPRIAMATQQAQAHQQETQVKMAGLQQKAQQQQREAADRVVQSQEKDKELQSQIQRDELDRQSEERIAQMEQDTERMRLAKELQSEQQQRVHDTKQSGHDKLHKSLENHQDRVHEKQKQSQDQAHSNNQQDKDHQVEQRKFTQKEF